MLTKLKITFEKGTMDHQNLRENDKISNKNRNKIRMTVNKIF